MPETPDLVPTSEVARIYGCSVKAVHRLVAAGKLEPAFRAPGIRGALMFRRADVLAYGAHVARRSA